MRELDADTLLFFDAHPGALPLLDALEEAVFTPFRSDHEKRPVVPCTARHTHKVRTGK